MQIEHKTEVTFTTDDMHDIMKGAFVTATGRAIPNGYDVRVKLYEYTDSTVTLCKLPEPSAPLPPVESDEPVVAQNPDESEASDADQ